MDKSEKINSIKDQIKMTKNCKGDGMCLTQEDLNSYTKDSDYICNYNCVPIKCPNYVICENSDPRWVLRCHNGLCTNCDISFGKWQGGKGILNMKDNEDCCICFEIKKCISNPKCDHFICIDCFKRCYYGSNEDSNKEPPFPYPDKENDYFENSDDPIWSNDETIMKWNQEWIIWDDARTERSQNEHKILAKCPLCRK